MIHQRRDGWGAFLLFLGTWALYATTAAPGTIFGDPSEYQFIPAIWGIAHPPGYAFYTLLAGIWQRIFRLGSVAHRTNLLAGAAGAWTASRIFLMTLALGRDLREDRVLPWSVQAVAALTAALALAITPDLWQHSIHANAHILSVAITATQLWLLLRWHRDNDDRWLFALAFFAGVGVTHHPITVFGLPAYAIFILVNRPKLLVQPKILLPFLGFGMLGLSPWLYFPLRSPSVPFGPTDMRTWEGFLRHATAQGLRVNLFHFGLADQFDRLRVFWTLLRLQYTWPLLLLIVLGIVALVRRKPRLALLWAIFLLGHLGFTLNSVQDVMAYLLHPVMALAFPLGIGILTFMTFVKSRVSQPRWLVGVEALLLIPVLWACIYTYPRISLREWGDADAFIDRLRARFAGRGTSAAFVSDWEHLTPYFYYSYVENMQIDESDLRPVYVTGASPWPDSVFGNLPLGPVYLSNYRRDIRDLGFRLRPEGDLWRVLEPPALEPIAPLVEFENTWVDGRLQLLGYDLLVTEARQGDVVPVVLYARVATTQTAILMPYARLGDVEQRWTTDSRRLSSEWLPDEIIAERYEFFVPYTMAPGTYVLHLRYADMSASISPLTISGQETELTLGEIQVTANPYATREADAIAKSLTNIGNEVALVSARARVGLRLKDGIWEQPLTLRAGQPLHLTLKWRVLTRPRTSYTIFIHLIDAAGVPWLVHDYTPLGGAFPSYLWFPKWLEGQQVIDPYRIVVPENIPAGTYWLEVGMYEMGSIRRIPQLNLEGVMTGDRFILGSVTVE